MLKLVFAATLLCVTTDIGFAQIQLGIPPSSDSLINSSPSAPLINFLDEQETVFAKWHIAPIIIPEGEKVGDIIDTDTTALIAGPDDCFDGLSIQQGSSNLPEYTALSEKGLAAALGVGDIATAKGKANEGQTYILDFQDVQVERVSTVQFRTKLKTNIPECASIRRFIDASYVPTNKSTQKIKTASALGNNIVHGNGVVVSDKPPPLLVGTLFRARRVIRVRLTRNIDASAQLSIGAKLLDDLGLGSRFNVSGAGGSASANTFTIEAKEVLPVALVPAFVVTATRKLASGEVQYKLASLDTDAIIEQIRVASEIENHSFEDEFAQMWVPSILTLNTKTWKFERHPSSEAA
jgi:hypothetical protein